MSIKMVYVLKDENNNTLEVYDNKDLVKKVMPHIESRLLVNIKEVHVLPLNPPIDMVGNKNFRQILTVKEFLDDQQ